MWVHLGPKGTWEHLGPYYGRNLGAIGMVHKEMWEHLGVYREPQRYVGGNVRGMWVHLGP